MIPKTFSPDWQKLKGFDWRSLKRYGSPKAVEDLNVFLEKLPQKTSKTLLIIVGIVWTAAGALGLFATVQLQQLTQLRAEWAEAEALKPNVPEIKTMPVSAQEIATFVDKLTKTYKDLSIKASGPSIVITATSTAYFPLFREVLGHVQSGDAKWRVNVAALCVGRECGREPLMASLKINTICLEGQDC